MRKRKTRLQVGGPFGGPEWYVYMLWAPLLLVLFVLIDNCGGEGAAGPSTSFLYTDARELELIAWQPDSSSAASIHGQWTILRAPGPLGDPTSSTNGFTGQLQPQRQLTITLGGQTVNGTLNSTTLQLPIITSSGQLRAQTW